jgi:hypothetical protein
MDSRAIHTARQKESRLCRMRRDADDGRLVRLQDVLDLAGGQ